MNSGADSTTALKSTDEPSAQTAGGFHPALLQAALDPSHLPTLQTYVRKMEEFFDSNDTVMEVASESRFERLLYHQLAAYYGITSKPVAPRTPDIVIEKTEVRIHTTISS